MVSENQYVKRPSISRQAINKIRFKDYRKWKGLPWFIIFLLVAVIIIANNSNNSCPLSNAYFVPGSMLFSPHNRSTRQVFSFSFTVEEPEFRGEKGFAPSHPEPT